MKTRLVNKTTICGFHFRLLVPEGLCWLLPAVLSVLITITLPSSAMITTSTGHSCMFSHLPSSSLQNDAPPTFRKVLPGEDTTLRGEFLQLCNIGVRQINGYGCLDPVSRRRGMHFYIESYIVRALAVAYDMTGKEAYLDACRTWSDRMITFQEKMIPKGFYYMNYNRKPFETSGDCYNGDNGSIAMAVLATAVRCRNRMERDRYLRSVQSYAALVLNNYVGPDGGITDGIWHTYDGQWWCSSGTVGSLFFLLYNETRNPVYLHAGLNAINWLNQQDLDTVGPFPLKMQGPSLPMYTFEAYSAGLPYINKYSQLYRAAKKQIDWFFKWASGYKFEDGQWGSKYGGIPFHLLIQGKAASDQKMLKMADKELKEIASMIFADNKPSLTQFSAFAMMSMAEKLSPGTIYRSSDLHYKTPNH